MKAKVDADNCTGCGLCTDIAAEVFEMEGDVATVIGDEVPAGSEDDVQEAMESCPSEAISIDE